MAEMDPAGLTPRNPCPITRPNAIPAKRYYDEAFYQAEVENLWPHVWQMACRLEQIPNPGDWIEYTNVGKSVLVVRTGAGVKAYHNHCRHRGVPVAGGCPVGASHSTAHGNCAKSGFVCPFHGWKWNMDGENTFVYGRHLFDEELLDPEELKLRPVRVETWGGCAFINLDDEAPSLRETLGPVLDRLSAHGADDLRAEWWFGTVLPANWKIAMEAFMEGYHVMMTHPQLQRCSPALYAGRYGEDTGGIGLPVDHDQPVRAAISTQIRSMELLNEGMGGMIQQKEIEIARRLENAELPDDLQEALPQWFGMVADAVSRQLRDRGENVPDLNAVAVSDPVEAVEFLFPHHFLLPSLTSFASDRIRPLGPEQCLFEIWSLTHYPPGEEPEPPMEPTILPYDSQDFPPIPRQDYSNIPIQQRGLHSDGFEFLRLSREREGLISNYQRVIDGYIAGKSPEKLARATQKLGGNFDGPIVDLGL
jgi:carnitine monooxygenase subunit